MSPSYSKKEIRMVRILLRHLGSTLSIWLHKAFTLADPKSEKDLWFDCFFALLGSAFVKVPRKILGEIET